MENAKLTPRQIIINRRRRADAGEEARRKRAEAIIRRERRRQEQAARRITRFIERRNNADRVFRTKMRIGDSINAFTTEIHSAEDKKRRFTERALYNSIRKVLDNKRNVGIATWTVVSYMDRNTNRPRYVTVDPNYMSSYEDFSARLREIESEGNPEGSGAVGNANFDLQLDRFVLRLVRAQAFGKSGILMFNTEGVEGKKSDCARLSFEKIGLEYNGSPYFSDIKEFAKKNGVVIYGNTFRISQESDWRNRETFDIDDPAPLRKGVKKPKVLKLTKLLDKDIVPCKIFSPDDGVEGVERVVRKPLLYCEKSKHMDVLKDDTPTLKDDLFISKALKIYKKVKDKYIQIFSPQELYKYQHNPSDSRHYFIYFDYETVVDFKESNQMRPFSLSCYKTSRTIDGMPDEGECSSFVGWDCTKQFANYFLANQENEVYTFVSFNGSNFDNIILLRELLILNLTEEYKERFNISDIFYNGNQLISFRLNGRHTFFDLGKYILGSLANACKNFNVPEKYRKKGFDHDMVQSLYDDNKLDALLNDSGCDFYKSLVEYNNLDCISLAHVHRAFRSALGEIPVIQKYNLLENLESESKTIGSLIWKIFSKHMKDRGFYQPQVSYNIYNDLQRSKVAGRVELFNGSQEITETVASADICSAYPYEMAVNTNWFPVGEKPYYDPNKSIEENEIQGGNYVRSSVWVEPPDEQSHEDDDTKIAFYYCTFNQSKLLDNNRANIYPQKIFNKQGLCEKNLWETRETITDVLLPNITIKRLRDAGVDVQISTEHKGLIFSHKIKNIELFEPILEFMKGKNEQDEYDRTGDARYNQSLRAMYKLLPNSLSGKVTEGLHVEKTREVDFYEFAELQEKVEKGKLKNINAIDIVGDKVFATTTEFEHNLIREQRPIHIASLIYAYTHRTMSESLYDKFGLEQCIYTDTDACKVRHRDFLTWASWAQTVTVPHWEEVEKYDERYKTHKLYDPNSKVFGSFENEVDTVNNHSWFQAKKQYLISSDAPGYEPKMSFKGVKKADIMINIDFLPEFVETKKLCGEDKYIINNVHAAYKYAQSHKEDSVANNYNKLFKMVKEEGGAYLLCSSFAKNIKNSMTCPGLADEDKLNKSQNTISLRQMLKHVKA